MYPKPIQRLIELLAELPGIGPRQAARIAFFVLRGSQDYALALSEAVAAAKKKIIFCKDCLRSLERDNGAVLCSFCGGDKRSRNTVMVVEKEMDIANIERAGIYQGLYHVLGGNISLLDAESPKRLRLADLYARMRSLLEEQKESFEVIIATGQTSEGDSTAMYLSQMLLPLKEEFPHLSISRLGRGLSMGTEVEYADEVTLENALKHRIGA